MKSKFPFSFVFLFLIGCGLGGPLREDKGAQGYRLGKLPGPPWVESKKNESGASNVFENSATHAVLALNSVCDRYAEASLENLSRQLQKPFSSLKIINQEKGTIDGREALWTRLSGELDGVEVNSFLAVFRKDNCVFDFQIHSPGALSEGDEKDFRNFVNDFRYSGPK